MNQAYISIGCNKYQFYGKLFWIVFFIWITDLFLTHPLKDTPPVFIRYCLFPALVLFLSFNLVLMIVELLFLANGLEIDYGKNTLVLKYFLKKSEVIELEEIAHYSETALLTKSSRYECGLIYTKSKKKFLLGEFNLREYLPIKTFLDANEVEFHGHEKISIIAYFKNYFFS